MSWEDETGSVWSYEALHPGNCLLELQYTATHPKGVWIGEARTKAAAVEIRELKASTPVVANQIEVCALADDSGSLLASR